MLTVRASAFALFALVMSSYLIDRTHQGRNRLTSYEKMKRLVGEMTSENADLKRENIRLKQMLDMLGGDTDPPIEQSTQNTTAIESKDEQVGDIPSTNQTQT